MSPPDLTDRSAADPVRVQGRASEYPAIVLEAGRGGCDAGWVWLRSFLGEHTRVLGYDRGRLWRTRGLSSFGMAATAGILKSVVTNRVASPFVLVAHSQGALYAQQFAAAYPEDVLGIVLLDPPPDDPGIVPGAPNPMAKPVFRALTWVQVGILTLMRMFAWLGLRRGAEKSTERLRQIGLPKAEAKQLAKLTTDPGFLATFAREMA